MEYESPGHPESPDRVRLTYAYLKDKDFEFFSPNPAEEKDILLAHSLGLLRRVKNLDFFDADTPAIPGIFDYACLSAGSAITAMEFALEGIKAFSLMRPPGHHAARDTFGGFCYFNNIAIAAQKALDLGKRTAILDIDCHHGNGTQDIFLGKDRLLYVSLHQAPLYPGTGLASDQNCLNFPLNPATDERGYLKVLRQALERIRKFSPDILAISAGFDTYKDDPLTQMGLEVGTFGKIGQLIQGCNLPCFCVLEGGYSPDLKECIYEFLQGLR